MSSKIKRKTILDLLQGVEENSASLLGTQVKNPEDLAQVAEVCRSPRFETFHYIFTRESQVVGSTAVSCRQIQMSSTFVEDRDSFLKTLMGRAAAVKADTLYFLHNHPSGDPTPSVPDLETTKKLISIIPDSLSFGGHVVINSKRYSVISSEGTYDTFPIDYSSSYNLEDLRKADSLFDKTIRSPENLANCAKEVQKSDNSFQLVGLNTKNKINSLYDLSYDVFNSQNKRLLSTVRKWAYASGVLKFALVNFNPQKITDSRRKESIKGMAQSGIILDVITHDGLSLRQDSDFTPQMDFRYRHKKDYEINEYDKGYHSDISTQLEFVFHQEKDVTQQASPFSNWIQKQDIEVLACLNVIDSQLKKALLAFKEGDRTNVPLELLWKLEAGAKRDGVTFHTQDVERKQANPELIKACERAALTLEGLRNRASQKVFEGTQVNANGVSNEMLQKAADELQCLSKVMHGQCDKDKTWDHHQGSFIDEAFVPAREGQFTDTPEPDYVRSLVRRYNAKINGAQANIAAAHSTKMKI